MIIAMLNDRTTRRTRTDDNNFSNTIRELFGEENVHIFRTPEALYDFLLEQKAVDLVITRLSNLITGLPTEYLAEARTGARTGKAIIPWVRKLYPKVPILVASQCSDGIVGIELERTRGVKHLGFGLYSGDEPHYMETVTVVHPRKISEALKELGIQP